MAEHLDFDSTKKFRDDLIRRTLQKENGPQTFTSSNYYIHKLSDFSNNYLGTVVDNRTKDLSMPQKSNIFKPIEYNVVEGFKTIPVKSGLNLYPYFNSNVDHTLVGILTNNNFENESKLFQFAVNYIKNEDNGPLQSRIKQNFYSNTIGKVNAINAMEGNLSTAVGIINGQIPLVSLNKQITVSSSIVGKGVDFVQTVLGVELPFSKIDGEYLTIPKKESNNIISKAIDKVGDFLGVNKIKGSTISPSEVMLKHTGSGTKKLLFESLSYSKYNPNYDKYEDLLTYSFKSKPQYIGKNDGDVSSSISDNNGRTVRSPYYLSLLFDETQARLFQTDNKSGVAGSLTWFTNKSKNMISDPNVEDTFSTEFQFRSGSILEVTQQILDSLPGDSSSYSHVANVIDQTSKFFKNGDISISKGSAIKYVKDFNKEETGIEYCRVWTKDRSYSKYSNTMKRTTLLRKYDSSVLSTPWNLNIAPISNGKGSFEGSTNIVKDGDGFRAKKYMFSIENLAWKTSNKPEFTYEDLPYCERGPNGGRIMWFPPYGVEITEQNSAKWDESTFIGRPEPIFTYQNTTRSATLKFKIVVDHPSILNLLVNKHFDKMSDAEADNYICAFFAGCEKLDFYDLIKKYSTLSTTDISMILGYLNGGKDAQTIKRLRTKIDTQGEYIPSKNTTETIKIEGYLYFNNDKPKNESILLTTDDSFDTLFNIYTGVSVNYLMELHNGLTGITTNWNDNTKHDYALLTKSKVFPTNNDDLTKEKNKIKTEIEEGFIKIKDEYSKVINGISNLKSEIEKKSIKQVTLEVSSSASSVAKNNYNLRLSYRRSYSVILDMLKRISKDGNIDKVKNKISWKNKIDNKTVKIQKEFEKDNEIKINLTDLGYQDNPGILIIKNVYNYGETLKIDNKNIDCNSNLFKDSKLAKTAPAAFWCRQSKVNINYDLTKTENEVLPTSTVTIEEYEDTIQTNKPTIDVLKKIVMKTLSECYYFQKLEESSPLEFKSLKEKLKYFHPAFHSMTPEGLNGRLTFLHQCIRPGDTIPVKGMSDTNELNARNTSFGPPPIVILRFGDFYNTKAIIRDYQITFDQNLWDLNPEGIGIQPMIADVNLQLSLFGGQGMEKPVNELQNALSSNFYANTEIYDYRATATEDRTKFNKEVLEGLLFNYSKTNTITKDSNSTNGDDASLYKYIGDLTNQKISYNNIIKDLYKTHEDYITSNKNGFEVLIKSYGTKISSLLLSEKYRTDKIYDVNGTAKQLIGNYNRFNDKFQVIEKFKNKTINNIKNSNLTKLFGVNFSEAKNTCSEEIIKPFIIEKLNLLCDDLTNNDSIKTIEKNRNNLISVLDKISFISKNSSDGYLDNNKKGFGRNITNFSEGEIPKILTLITNFLDEKYPIFQNTLDNSLFIETGDFTDIELKEIILNILKPEHINELNKKFTFNSKISFIPYEIENMFKKINDQYQTLKNMNIEMSKNVNKIFSEFIPSKIPKLKTNIDLNYNVSDLIELSNELTNELILINSIKNVKLKDKLNYYKP